MLAAVFRGMMWLGLGLIVAVVALWVAGPHESVDTEIRFDPSTVPEDLDGWLADREGRVPDLDPDHAKKILWAGAPGVRTDLAIVYLHGFSATSWEIRPVPDRVAEALGANLFFTRLAGHGRDGEALAEPSGGDWLEDVAEAMEVGRRLGNRVIVISTSTGSTLAAILAADPSLAEARAGLDGIVMISPNFRIANRASALLSWPAARYWAPWVAGPWRSFEPRNERHARHWTTGYPTVAALPVQAVIDYAAELDYGAAVVPVLFYFSDQDEVVDAQVTRQIAERWGGPVTVQVVEVGPGDDPMSHVIAGDILSPGQTPLATEAMLAWIRGL